LGEAGFGGAGKKTPPPPQVLFEIQMSSFLHGDAVWTSRKSNRRGRASKYR